MNIVALIRRFFFAIFPGVSAVFGKFASTQQT